MKKMAAPAPASKAPRTRPAAFLPLMLLLLCCVYTMGPGESITVLAGARQLPVYCVERDDNAVSISFDASWGGDKTMAILDILDRYNVKTTFFLVDIWTQKYPDLVREIIARGHEIGNHSLTHAHMSKLDRAGVIRELDGMAAGLEKVAGIRPVLFRPPYGEYNNLVVETARAQGYEAVQWSVDSQDWKNRGADDIITRAGKAQPGDIVLFHNDSQYIVEALPAVLDIYKKNGYNIVPVSEILLTGETQLDVQGRMRPLSTKIPEV